MGKTPELHIGLPTVPAASPASGVSEAVEIALSGRPMPTVPVPADPGFSLLAQASTAFEGVHPIGLGDLRVSDASFGIRPADAASVRADAFAPLHVTLERWPEHRSREAPCALRVEMIGPVSLALALCAAGVAQSHAVEAARIASVYRAEALMAEVRAVEPDLPIALVMDERRLVGSMHPTFPLAVRQVRSLLDPVVDAIDHAAGATPVLIGIHVPGRSDWRTIISSGVSLVSMPADSSVAGWSRWIQALLDNGGWIAWGAVPVDRPLGTSEELLWRQLLATWRDLEAAGVDGRLLRERSMVSPADGLGGFGMAQVGGMLELVDALAGRMQANAPQRPVSAGY
ncbi:MAG: hypothetical protein GY812_00840 [Actinomycetia bacterium]|nr:hypothetical protein [Actinomycetes bacterium]